VPANARASAKATGTMQRRVVKLAMDASSVRSILSV